MQSNHTSMVENAADVAAGAIGVAALVKWLPPAAAFLTVVWTAIRIYEWVESRWFKKGK